MLSLVLLLASESATSTARGGLALSPPSSSSSSTSSSTTLPPGATRDPRGFMSGTTEPPLTFNCTVGRVAAWMPTKLQWCCTYHRKGCPKAGAEPPEGKSFDCNTRELWIPPKVLWCCTYRQTGCPATGTPSATPKPTSYPVAPMPIPTSTTVRSISFDMSGGQTQSQGQGQSQSQGQTQGQVQPQAQTQGRGQTLGQRPATAVPPPIIKPYFNNITGAECAVCKMFCLDGFALGSNGCPICYCNPGSLVFDCTEPTPWFTQHRVWCCSLFDICTPAGPTPLPRPAGMNQMCKMDAKVGEPGGCDTNLMCIPTGTRLPAGLDGYGKCVSSLPTVKDNGATTQVPPTTPQPRSIGTGLVPGIAIGSVITSTTPQPRGSTASSTTPQPRGSTASSTTPQPRGSTASSTTTMRPRTAMPGTRRPVNAITTTPEPYSTPRPGAAIGEVCKYGWNTRAIDCAEPLTCIVTNIIEDPSKDPSKRAFEGVCGASS